MSEPVASRRRRWQACGAVALALACAGWWLDRPMFFAAWLSAWWFCLGLVLGAAANLRIHVLTGGRWGVVLAPAHAALQRPMPGLLLLFVPLFGGFGTLYPWVGAGVEWLGALGHPAFQQAWFAPAFVAARLACYAVAWWVLTRPAAQRSAGSAAVGLLVTMLLSSLAAVDLLMSLLPGWTSSVFGWLALTGQLTAGAAAATALAAAGLAGAAAPRADGTPPVWRDLGNLLLMYLMLQAYLQFMQLLIIWAENLPREISWYLPRLHGGWAGVGLVLVLLQLAVPLPLLLWRSIKDDRRRLARVAAGLVAAQALGAAWLVVPSVAPRSLNAWWLLPLCFVGMGLLLFGPALDRVATRERLPRARRTTAPAAPMEVADGRS